MRHVPRVAAELGDVLLDPLQREHQIEHAGVTRVCEFIPSQLRQVQIAKGVETVVHRDDDHIAPPAETGAVGLDAIAGVARVRAWMKPDEHRPLAAVAQARRPHVQVQAVFADGAIGWLRRDGREVDRVAYTSPRLRWHG